MSTLFEASPQRVAMESLRIWKKYMELEVRYKAGAVLVKAIAYFGEYERSVEVIAKSEQLLSSQHLKSRKPEAPLENLKAYFEEKGWEVVPVY